jgi:hypothetical protein
VAVYIDDVTPEKETETGDKIEMKVYMLQIADSESSQSRSPVGPCKVRNCRFLDSVHDRYSYIVTQILTHTLMRGNMPIMVEQEH